LQPYFNTFWASIQDLVAKSLVTSGEKTFLIEFLVLLCNTAPKAADRNSFLALVIDPLVREWESSPHFQSSENFFNSTGIKLLAQISFEVKNNPGFQVSDQLRIELQKASLNRRQLYFLANTFFVMLKRINHAEDLKTLVNKTEEPHPLSAFVSRLVAPTLMLIKMIHTLWNIPHSWVGIPDTDQIRSLLQISETERAFLLGEDPPLFYDEEGYTTQTFVLSKEIRKTRTWLGTIRDACYNLLGQLCCAGPSFYSLSGLSSAIVLNIFSFATAIESRHLRVLNREEP